jgi:putative transposase
MEYNPDIHHRRSIRLKGYDYSQEGMYFITICIQNRDCLFGEIVTNVGADLRVCPEMKLNDAGKMVEKWVHELENKFPDIKCGEFVVMPNHFHCIIIIIGHVVTVGADLRVCPNDNAKYELGEKNFGQHDEHDLGIMGEHNEHDLGIMGEHNERDLGIMGEHTGSPIHQIVQWFKTMSTNEYIRGVKTLGWRRFDGKLWQRNYWEHIIQDDQSFENISKYIINNPQNWDTDKLK